MVSEEELIEHHKEEVEQDEEHHSHLKKYYLYAVGGLLILFMLSFLFVTFPIGDILAGKIESSQLAGNVIDADSVQIIFSPGVLEKLQQIYARDQSVEFSVCMQGSVSGRTYEIETLYEPKIYLQQFNHVSFESCKNSLILLHSHPHQRCIASSTDINTLEQVQLENPNTLMLVMCAPDKFSVYE
jgi:hypothetical protein